MVNLTPVPKLVVLVQWYVKLQVFTVTEDYK